MNRDAMLIAFAILAGCILISGSILYTKPQEGELLSLREEVMKLESLLDFTLQTLHHERLLHFGTTFFDMEGMN